MAIPALEYREQLLAQGCEEGLADAVLSLVEAARDDAEAEVIMKVGERIAHSEQQLAEHVEQNAQQFHAIESAIRESAAETTRTLTAQIEQQATETNRQIAETNQRGAQIEQQVADLRQQTAETNQRGAQIEQQTAETNRRVAQIEQQVADLRQQTAETNRQIAETNQRVAQIEQQVADLRQQTAETNQRVALVEQQVADLRLQLAEHGADNERGLRELMQVFSKGQDRLIQGILGIAALIVGATVAIISALAVFG